MEKIKLYNWADTREGIVRTESWGYCTSRTCMHESHDPYFEFPVTSVDGEIIWRGDYGEYIVITKNGRAFYTRKTYIEFGRAPIMKTFELNLKDGKIVIPSGLVQCMKNEYGSLRHERILALSEVAFIGAGRRKK